MTGSKKRHCIAETYLSTLVKMKKSCYVPLTPSKWENFSISSSFLMIIALYRLHRFSLSAGLRWSYNPWSNNTISAFLSLPRRTNTVKKHITHETSYPISWHHWWKGWVTIIYTVRYAVRYSIMFPHEVS